MRGLDPESRPGGVLEPPGTALLDFGRTALFLDLDGTLAGFESRPELVGPQPSRTVRIRALAERLGGRLAVLSGRSIDDIDRILDGAALAAAGVHGLERRRADGRLLAAASHRGVGEATREFRDFAARHPGALLEEKPQSAALHYRNAPDCGAQAKLLAQTLADRTGLVLQEGTLVLELRTPGADKGDALRAFMDEDPFRGAVPLMLGDDLTDEAAFRAAAGLGGAGLLVGPERATAAQYRLENPDAVAAWLDESLARDTTPEGRTGVHPCRV